MHKYFFFIFLIAFVAIASSITTADTENQIEKGKNYDRELLDIVNGSKLYRWTTTHERLLDYYDLNGKPVYVDFKTHEDSKKIYFESALNTIVFDKQTNTIETYGGGKLTNQQVEIKLSHSIKESLVNSNDWQNILTDVIPSTASIINNDGIKIISIRDDFKTIYDINQLGFEYTYEYENNDATKTNHKYGFTTVCNGAKCNDIKINDELIPLGTVKEKSEIINSKLEIANKIVDLKNEQHNQTSYLKHINSNEVILDFTDQKTKLDVGDTSIVDPTFGYTAGTWKRYYSELTGAIANCKTDIAVGGSDTNNQGILRSDDTGGRCQLYTVRNDISSLPSIITVSSVTARYDVSAVSSPNACDVFAVTNDPNSASDATIWTDAHDGNQYVSDETGCNTTGNNKTVAFASTAYTDIESLRAASNGVFTFAMVAGDWNNVIGTSETTLDLISGSVDLQIEYVAGTNPDAITDLSAVALGQTEIFLDWTEPNLHGKTLQGYQINGSTSNPPLTILVNNTGTSTSEYTDTGLTGGVTKYYRVSAWTDGGKNATGNIASATTSTANPPDPVTVLTANTLNFTSMILLWDEPSLNNETLTGYFIKYGTSSPPTLTLIANTGTSTTNRTITGLTIDQTYYFLVSAITAGGTNFNGTIATNSTGDPAQPVKDWMNLITVDLGHDDAFGLDMGIAAIVILFGTALASKNIVYGAVLFSVILGFAVFFEIVEIPAIILSSIIFFVILIIFSARKPTL